MSDVNPFHYQRMNPAELAEIIKRAGHELTEEQALKFLRTEMEDRLRDMEFERRTRKVA